MSQDEVDAYLKTAKTVRVATVKADGNPHVVPLWFVYDGKNVFFRAGRESAKTKNIRHNSNICLLFDSGEKFPDFKGVMIEGDAEILLGYNVLKNYDEMLLKKYSDSRAIVSSSHHVKPFAYPRVIIKVTPSKFHSWDYSKDGNPMFETGR